MGWGHINKKLGAALGKANNLSRNIIIALVLGALVGTYLPQVSPFVSWMGLTFKLSLQMIVMPVVLTSILCGMESIGDIRKLKSLGKRAFFYYFTTTFVAIVVGLFLVTSLEPGVRPPRDELVLLVNNAQGENAQEVKENILAALTIDDSLPNASARAPVLDQDLARILTLTASTTEFKKEALRYLGSLELRSKLLSDTTVTPTVTSSFQNFFEDQLRNALINPFEALAKQQVLAVIVFTVLFGAAMTMIGPLGLKFFEINRAVNLAIIKIITLIMRMAPLGVFGLLVSVIS